VFTTRKDFDRTAWCWTTATKLRRPEGDGIPEGERRSLQKRPLSSASIREHAAPYAGRALINEKRRILVAENHRYVNAHHRQ